MDASKLKSLSVGDLVTRAQALAEKLAPTDPDFANDLALSLVKGLVNGNEDLSSIVSLFGNDDDISGGLFPEEPVTVTKTTTSVGGNIDPDEAAKAIQDAGGEPAASDTELAGETTPEEDAMLKQAVANDAKEKSKAEEPPKEDKPAEEEKKEPPKEDKPKEEKKEDKQEQSDTDKNIISTLADLK